MKMLYFDWMISV